MKNLTRLFSTSVHEAAHAVMHCRAGVLPKFIEVSTQSDLTLKNRKVEGLCKGGAGLPIPFGFPYLIWNSKSELYDINRTQLQKDICRLNDETYAAYEKITRDNIIMLMSGRIAEQILGYEEWDWMPYGIEGEDFTLADAMCDLLYEDKSMDEYQKLFEETENLLKESETWKRVIKIAEVLNKSFRVDGDELELLLIRRP